MTTATLEERVKEVSYDAGRAAHQAVLQGRHAAEQLKDRAELNVRRHPFESVGWTFGAGALLGCMLGFALGRSCQASRGR